MKELKVKLIDGAFMPTRATEQAAGYDLYSPIDFTIMPCLVMGHTVQLGRFAVDTGVAVELKPGYEVQVRGRSGLAFKEGIEGRLGTIDADFRGTMKVLLYNTTNKAINIKRGERIAQFVVSKIEAPELVEAAELSETERGEGGLGHTGK